MVTKKMYQHERTLSPLSEREFSSEDEDPPQQNKRNKGNDLNKNLFIDLAEQNKIQNSAPLPKEG